MTGRSDSYYSYYYYWYGMDEDTKNYLSNDLEWGSLVNLSVEAFDPSFTDNYGQAVEGGIQNVTFWENNPSLGEPTVIGEAMNKYNNIYSIAWKPMYIGQTFVWAEVVDLDQNLIRTDVRCFNIGTNSKKAPTVEIQSIRKTGQGNMAVRVNFFDFMYSNDYDYRYSIESFLSYNERNAFLKGDFSLEATINGVTVASIDLKKLPLYQETIQVGNGQGFAGVGNRFMDTLVESPPTYSYSYEFQAIPIEESGSLDVQVILMSRQSADNYRKVAYSTVETVQVSEDELFAEEIPNLPPEGALLSPRNSDLARAEAVLTDTDVQTSSEFGQIERIAMTSIGRNYDPDNLPEVIIQGGGGTGAEATVEIVDGGIADLMVLSWGENYVDSELNDGGLWITPIDENNGSGFMAQIKVSNGVLDDVQNIENGAILNGGAGYEDIVGKKGYVRVFDYNKGNGAVVTFLLPMM